MALRGITPRRRPLLPVPRAFFSSNPPFPPPPPPANGPDAAHPLPSSPQSNPGAPPRDSASALFQDIRERLRVSPRSPPPRRIPMNHSPKELPDVRQALESFRRSGGLTSPSTPGASPSTPGATPSFMDLLKNQRPNTGQGLGSFDPIRGSLKGALPAQQRQPLQPTPFLSHKSDIFKKELERGGKAGEEEEKDSGTTLMRVYSYEDLGKRLGDLRPAGAVKDGKEWFSLEELQGRIAKLVELEKQEHRLGAKFAVIRKSILNLKQPEKTVQGQGVHLQTMLSLGGQMTPDYTRLPPQEELVERYFHPDHMSSEEKMKLELQRVRDEFKMSENDCGSARVQSKYFIISFLHHFHSTCERCSHNCAKIRMPCTLFHS
uniref:Uncharacterized protein n=1 Tax=Setaria italica TaxID=4555 RepID=K3YTD9_SETIT